MPLKQKKKHGEGGSDAEEIEIKNLKELMPDTSSTKAKLEAAIKEADRKRREATAAAEERAKEALKKKPVQERESSGCGCGGW